ncbi:MAG TPA: leucine-rich repeat domain-containing protein, partial [Prevotella sp.]
GTGCKTVYLPYPAKLPETLVPYVLNKRFDSNGKEYLQFERTPGNTIAANTPYLLVPEKNFVNGTKLPTTEGPVEVPVTPEPQDVSGLQDAGVSFTGTTHSITNAAAAALGAYNLNKNIWRPVSTATPSGYIHRFRSFIKVNAAPAKAFSFAIFLSDNATTGIEEVNIRQDLKRKQLNIYTIDGKFVGRDFDALESGNIYIVNGKKLYKM